MLTAGFKESEANRNIYCKDLEPIGLEACSDQVISSTHGALAMRWVLRSKIHKAIVTEANLGYIGSITIDKSLVEKAGFWEGERVLITSNDSGARLETYIILGEGGSGTICMNGAAAHLIKAGEEIIIMGFELTDRPIMPQVVLVDKQNRFVRSLGNEPPRLLDHV